MPLEQQREVSDGPLLVRVREDGANRVIVLVGELDLANAGTAEAELEAALVSGPGLVVDMRKLEFIDSTGIALLIGIINGSGGSAHLSFIPSEFPAVKRVLELTGVAERMALADR